MGLAFFLSNAAVISITTVPKLGNLILQVRRKHRPPSKRKYIERLLVQYSTAQPNSKT
jgi:hypothetical protein